MIPNEISDLALKENTKDVRHQLKIMYSNITQKAAFYGSFKNFIAKIITSSLLHPQQSQYPC